MRRVTGADDVDAGGVSGPVYSDGAGRELGMKNNNAAAVWPSVGARPRTCSQQALLRDAMVTLGMTRQDFAQRLRVPVRTLDKWLLPETSADHREMPDIARAYIADILHWTTATKEVS